MKRNLTIFALITCIFFSPRITANSLEPQKEAKLIEHLIEVNKIWSQHQADLPILEVSMAFLNESQRIQMHLLLVKNLLEKNDCENSGKNQTRNQLLQHLEEYANNGIFPINSRHANRIPYFVDDYNTPCAVSELLLYAGESELVERIKTESNYAYLGDMNYPELGIWALDNGFSLDELAWIQPGYPPSLGAWEPLGTGINNGSVNALVVYNDIIVMAGEFSSANNMTVSNVVGWDGEDYVFLGNGIDGIANCAVVHDGDLYLGGLFNNFSSDLAKWNGSSWTYESVFSSKLGEIYSLLSLNGELFAAGYATGFAGLSDFVAQSTGGSWNWIKQFDGAVRTLENYNGKLVVAGDFLSYFVGSGQEQANRAAILDNGVWSPLGTTLDNSIYDLHYHSPTNQLFACGLTQDENMNLTMGLAVYESDWSGTVEPETFATGISEPVISEMFSSDFNLFAAGWFGVQSGMSIGSGLGSVNLLDTVLYMQPHVVPDDAIHTGVISQDQIYIGGEFTSLTGVNFDRVAKLDLSTGINFPESFRFTISPNPASNVLNLQSEKSFQRDWTISLLNLEGKKIAVDYSFSENQIEISLLNLPSGTYVLLLEDSGLVVGSGKFVVR